VGLITTVEHPVMAGREDTVKTRLEKPGEVRQSRIDPEMLLFYEAEGVRRRVCAVTKQTDADAFLVTAYPTDAIERECGYGRR
jgi:hypothetical protein